jgi:hypothetical protein
MDHYLTDGPVTKEPRIDYSIKDGINERRCCFNNNTNAFNNGSFTLKKGTGTVNGTRSGTGTGTGNLNGTGAGNANSNTYGSVKLGGSDYHALSNIQESTPVQLYHNWGRKRSKSGSGIALESLSESEADTDTVNRRAYHPVPYIPQSQQPVTRRRSFEKMNAVRIVIDLIFYIFLTTC